MRLTRANPLAVALWGLIVAAALVIGSLPLFFGLAVVMPVLGHATWRFYRRAVERDPAREVVIEAPRGRELRWNRRFCSRSGFSSIASRPSVGRCGSKQIPFG